MLGFLGPPGVVELEAFVAEAGPTLGAALAGLLLGRLTELAHDGGADVHRLPVTLHHSLQGQVSEKVAQAPLAQVHVMLTGGTWEEDTRSVGRAALPAGVRAESCGREGPAAELVT